MNVELNNDFMIKLREIVEADTRYDIEAYFLVQNALGFLISNLDERRHVTGRELLEAIRQYTRQEYGLLGRDVLEHWGVYRCEDFGEIVFNMVDRGLLKKTEKDSREDFTGGYDFNEVFD